MLKACCFELKYTKYLKYHFIVFFQTHHYRFQHSQVDVSPILSKFT